MAESDSKAIQDETTKEPVFAGFEWNYVREIRDEMVPGSGYGHLASQVLDVAAGVSVILELIEHDYTERDCEGGQPVLNNYHRETLTRLAIQSLLQLHDAADSGLKWAYDYHTDAGRKSRQSFTEE